MLKTILFIAPDISVKGGISTVIKGLLGTALAQENKFYLVASHVDGSKARKYLQAVTGLLKTAYYLIFKQIDIIHIHGGDITSAKRKYFYFKMAKLFKCKIIYHMHGGSLLLQYQNTSAAWERCIRSLFEGSDFVILLSKRWLTQIKQIAPKSNVQVLYNAVKLPDANKKICRAKAGYINVTFLGLIADKKGIFDLIEVVSRLLKNGFNIHLTIGGNGNTGRLYKEIKSKGLQDNITYAGWIVGDDKDTLMRNTDIFVLPSYGEGMPMTILEAMSYAIPVIATNVGGIPELIKDGETGYLIEPGNLDQLLEKMKKLIEDENMRLSMGKKGIEAVEKDFSISEMANKIDEIYESLLS